MEPSSISWSVRSIVGASPMPMNSPSPVIAAKPSRVPSLRADSYAAIHDSAKSSGVGSGMRV
jgi:hypothetical protein